MHHHGAGLRLILSKADLAAGAQDAVVAGLQTWPRSAPGLAPRADALLDYAAVFTLTPPSVHHHPPQRLRDQGLDDRAIHDTCAVVAYFAFVNRIADGLGVELES